MARARFRKFLSVGGTFAVALAIGFAMQNGDVLAARFAGAPAPATTVPAAAPAALRGVRITEVAPGISPSGGIVAAVASAPGLAAAQAGGLAPPRLSRPDAMAPARPLPMLHPAARPGNPAAGGSLTFGAEGCDVTLEATAAPGAMLDLVLVAPCAPHSVAVIHHQGMMASVLTDAAGEVRLALPALARRAVVVAQVGVLPGATAEVEMPEFDGLERAVLQWQGETGLGLNARADGASYAGPGAANPDAGGGWVSAVGDVRIAQGYRAEIYSRPAGVGPVALDVEAAVLPATCGREIAAQTIQVAPGLPAVARDVTLQVPGCQGVGEYLVLSNLLRDLTLAMR